MARIPTYPPRKTSLFAAIARRFLEPLILLLLFAAGGLGRDGRRNQRKHHRGPSSFVSVALDAVQEGRAAKAADALKQSVALKAEVKRDGQFLSVPTADVVPGDVFRVRTGDVVPADALVLEVSSFTANEAALTGEPYPVEKRPGTTASITAAEATNALFRGSIAQTGEATALAVATGRKTLFGAVASVLAEDTAPSPFQRDLRALGFVVARAAAVLSVAVLTINLLFGRPLIESLMFAVALAVGLTPELLPMITTVTLSRGAVRMARRKVIVKRLASIHDLGAMTVPMHRQDRYPDLSRDRPRGQPQRQGRDDPRIAMLAGVCAELAGDRGAMDGALVTAAPRAAEGWTAQGPDRLQLRAAARIGAGAGEGGASPDLQGRARVDPGGVRQAKGTGQTSTDLNDEARDTITAKLNNLAAQGLRAIAVATKACTTPGDALAPDDEADLIFEGFCTFADPRRIPPAKPLKRLAAAGVRVKVLSGDDPLVVARIAGLVGLNADAILSGPELATLSNDALAARVQSVELYGRLTPDQKVRVVRALQARGETVGFLGDGVNDAPRDPHGRRRAFRRWRDRRGAGGSRHDPARARSQCGGRWRRGRPADIRQHPEICPAWARAPTSATCSRWPWRHFSCHFCLCWRRQILLNNLLYDLSEVGIPFDAVDPSDLSRPQR